MPLLTKQQSIAERTAADRYVWNAPRNELPFILSVSYLPPAPRLFSFPFLGQLQNLLMTHLKWDPLMNIALDYLRMC